MSAAIVLFSVALAFAAVVAAGQMRNKALLWAAGVLGVIVIAAGVTSASFRYVAERKVGVVVKNVGFKSLPPGKIIATEGEKGPQAKILPPGWHPWYWPFIYDIDYQDIVEVPAGSVGLLTAADGLPLPEDTTYAPEWPAENEKRMSQDAGYFLTEGEGYRGPQTTVIKPGSHRINPKLFKIEIAPITTIDKATVGVVKSNVGERPAAPVGEDGVAISGRLARLVDRGQRGIWRPPLRPGQYYLNTSALEVTVISTRKQVVRYTDATVASTGEHEESEIIVRTSDGFTFPVDVRVEYEIEPDNAPLLVATVGDDQQGLRSVMNSAVRAIFRNNAEGVKALNYVQQRSQQEEQSKQMLQDEMEKIGVTVTAVRIGDVGDEQTLGTLLKTQTDREIALQEQETFKEQQRAQEQKKELTRTEQEAEEEKRLATAKYAVQVAEEARKQRVIEAEAEAEAVRIKADAQANAYRLIAEQIGSGNAALVELLRIVGEQGIQITPRVMVTGAGETGSTGDAQTTALIGTMLDSMVRQGPEKAPAGE